MKSFNISSFFFILVIDLPFSFQEDDTDVDISKTHVSNMTQKGLRG